MTARLFSRQYLDHLAERRCEGRDRCPWPPTNYYRGAPLCAACLARLLDKGGTPTAKGPAA